MTSLLFPSAAALSVVRAAGHALIRASLVGFGYVLPALSSVRAVVHKDVEAYHLWVTYFLILHIYSYIAEPFFDLALHPLLKLLMIMWLSLPRYRGALFVYNRLVLPVVEKYEKDVDAKIDAARREVRRRALEAAVGAGWGALSHLGQIWTAVMMVSSNEEGQQQSQQQNIQSDSRAESTAGNSKEKEDEKQPGDEAIQDSPNKRRRRKRPENPQHSITESLSYSSVGSLEDDGDDNAAAVADDEDAAANNNRSPYVRDFLAVLSRGLFVFAYVPEEEASTGGDEGAGSARNGDERKKGGEGAVKQRARKTFQLRIFSYEEEERCLVISSVDSDAVDDGHVISMDEIGDAVPSGPQGVKLLARGCEGVDIQEADAKDDVKDDDDDEPAGRRPVLAEVVLSDEGDRETLLRGVRACLLELRRGDRDRAPPSAQRALLRGELDSDDDDSDAGDDRQLHLTGGEDEIGQSTSLEESPLCAPAPSYDSADSAGEGRCGGMLAEFDAEAD